MRQQKQNNLRNNNQKKQKTGGHYIGPALNSPTSGTPDYQDDGISAECYADVSSSTRNKQGKLQQQSKRQVHKMFKRRKKDRYIDR